MQYLNHRFSPSMCRTTRRAAGLFAFLLFLLGPACKDEQPSPPPAALRGRPILDAGRPSVASQPAPADAGASPARPPMQYQNPFYPPIEDPPIPEKSPGLYPIITFKQLASYPYKRDLALSPSNPRPDQIPPEIKALNGTPATIIGFMAPLNIDDEGRVSEFMLMRNQLYCCYGKPVELNEWISVTAPPGKPVEELKDLPIHVSGRLMVSEKDVEGWVVSIYQMELEEVKPMPGAKPRPLSPRF